MTKFYSSLSICLLFLVPACKVDPRVNAPLPSGVEEILPPGFPAPAYTYSTNVLTQDKFILGRSLFYDPILSLDNTVTCGSCHEQRVAFANEDHQFSHGVNSLFGRRNAPALFNLAWHPYFMYDGAASNIEVQPVLPLCNPVEMGETMEAIVAKLNASAKYKKLFKTAFGSDTITASRMLSSIAQFTGLMYSYNSKYDQVVRNENGMTFTAQEQSGFEIFKAKCSACHVPPLFTDFKFRNNGLQVDPVLQDSGRAHVYPDDPANLYKFKTPSLRNIDKTGPYMHDGRLDSLKNCLDHYTSGIINRVNLDPILENGISLSDQDKKDLIAFLRTLTDYTLLSDPRFFDPNKPH